MWCNASSMDIEWWQHDNAQLPSLEAVPVKPGTLLAYRTFFERLISALDGVEDVSDSTRAARAALLVFALSSVCCYNQRLPVRGAMRFCVLQDQHATLLLTCRP